MDITSSPPAKTEYVRLPDTMPSPGSVASYDSKGEPDTDGNVTIYSYGVQFIWARFLEPIKAGQIATMIVENIPGAFIMDGAATEWNMVSNEPTISEGVIMLLSVERGVGVGTIVCRNVYDADLWVAAGIGTPIFPPS